MDNGHRRNRGEAPSGKRRAGSWGLLTAVLVLWMASGGRAWALYDDLEKYGFDTWTDGWEPSTNAAFQGITNVSQSSWWIWRGANSLRMDCDLRPWPTNHVEGRVLVDMEINRPCSIDVPVDLDNREVYVHFQFPIGSWGTDPSYTNRYRIFVMDDQGRAEYDRWFPMYTNGSRDYAITVSTNAPPGGSVETGFNPARVRWIGMSVDMPPGSTGTYAGPVYLDQIRFYAPPAQFLPPDEQKYSFDDDDECWQCNTYSDTMAATSLSQSVSAPSNGTGCLAVDLNLRGGDTNYSKGEVYVDMEYHPPVGAQAPVDLMGKRVSAWVYCPPGSEGPASNPNTVSLFVKDTNWHSFYGSVEHIYTNYWFMISVTPGTNAPNHGWMDAGFDPHHVKVVGLKIATDSGSTSVYTGKIYIDGVAFADSDPPQPENIEYDYEQDEEGFLVCTNAGDRCITAAVRTVSRALNGVASLRLSVDLDGSDTNRDSGEVSVDMLTYPPYRVDIPVDLEGREIAFYVYCPTGARQGCSSPNGLQVFAKDTEWRSEYGTWTPIVEETWQKVVLVPATTAPTNGSMDAGFDPTRIRTIGIKLAAQDAAAAYSGPIYVDAVGFPADQVPYANLRYDFEVSKEGWAAETNAGITAVTNVARSPQRYLSGTNGLEMDVSVAAPGTNRAQGSAWVDMRYYPPPVVRAPFNLQGTAVHAYVYCPTGTQSASWTEPNTMRIFVKDGAFRAEYGAPVAMRDGQWIMLAVVPDTNTPVGGYMETNFTPTNIVAVGVELDMGGTYTGVVYLDRVEFPAEALGGTNSGHRYDFDSGTYTSTYPRWFADYEGWNAYAWTNAYQDTNEWALRADAVFAGEGGAMTNRKGVFVIEYNPPLNLSTKGHRIVQVQLRFEPPVEGLLCFNATIALYDKITDQWYTHTEAVGGSDWNILRFDLDDGTAYDTNGPSGPMDARAIGALAVQVFANCSYTGAVYLDAVIVGGEEEPGHYQPIQGGVVGSDGRRFVLDGTNYYFAGANVEYLYSVSDDTVAELLDLASNLGIRVVRAWAFHEGQDYSFQPERGIWNQMAFEHLDRIVAKAGDDQVRLLLGLVDNWGHNGGMFKYMEWVLDEHPESLPEELRTTNALGTIPLHDEFYTNAYAKQWYKDFVTKLLTRTNSITGVEYRNDPTIFGWEIVNEPRCETDGSKNRAYGRFIHDWICEMGAFVRTLDTNHMLAAGEEGGFIMPYSNANQAAYQEFPDNYWLYGLRGGAAYADFASDYSSASNYVEWQEGTETNPGTVHGEWRTAATNMDFCPFRLYIDRKEYNLYHTNWTGSDGRCYDQRREWMLDHVFQAHQVLGKPVVLEEFGIHAFGWTYGGFYGEYQYERVPEYDIYDRTNLYRQIYDYIEDFGINGSFFWNLGYTGMWEDVFCGCEEVGDWVVHPYSDATNIVASTNFVLEGSNSLCMAYDPAHYAWEDKAIFELPTNEQWLVRNVNGQVTGANRVKFFWNLYAPTDSLYAALALTAGSASNWYESPAQPLSSGWNRVMFDLSAGNWKAADTGWSYTRHLLDVLDDVHRVSLVVTGYSAAGEIYVDDISIRRDDGFVIYGDDPVCAVIQDHAAEMRSRTGISNTAPVSYSAYYHTDTNQPCTVRLTATDEDGDALAFSIVQPPVLGMLTGQAPVLVYVPTNGSAGTDYFTFTADDGAATSAVATNVITITSDIDADGLPDAWELGYFAWLGIMDDESDYDGDTADDHHEYVAGTDPTDTNSWLHMLGPELPGTGSTFVIQWASVTGRTYSIEACSNLLDVFTTIASNIAPTPPVNTYTDQVGSSESEYYRVRTAH